MNILLSFWSVIKEGRTALALVTDREQDFRLRPMCLVEFKTGDENSERRANASTCYLRPSISSSLLTISAMAKSMCFSTKLDSNLNNTITVCTDQHIPSLISFLIFKLALNASINLYNELENLIQEVSM